MSKKHVLTLIKKYFIAKNVNHHLSFKCCSNNIKDHWTQITITNIMILKTV